MIVAATDLPVSADLENAFADEPDGVAETIRLAIEVGLAGALGGGLHRAAEDPSTTSGSRPNASRRRPRPRTRARPPRAHRPGGELPARPARPGRHDRQAAGLPGGRRRRPVRSGPARIEDIRQVMREVDRPVNVLALDGVPPVAELAEAGRQPDLGRRLVRVRRPGRTGQRRHRAARPGHIRLPGGRAAGARRRPPRLQLIFPNGPWCVRTGLARARPAATPAVPRRRRSAPGGPGREVEHLQVDAFRADLRELGDLRRHLAGRPGEAVARSSSGSRPIASARRRNSASSLPQHTTWATE